MSSIAASLREATASSARNTPPSSPRISTYTFKEDAVEDGHADHDLNIPHHILKIVPITSSAKIDEELRAIFALLIRDYITTWYNLISENEDFVNAALGTFIHVVRELESRLKALDWVMLVTHDIPNVLRRHVNDYRDCKDKLGSTYAGGRTLEELFHGAQPHIAIESPQAEEEYLRLTAEKLTEVLFPSSEKRCEVIRLLLREILGSSVFHYGINLVTEPDYINQIILSMLGGDDESAEVPSKLEISSPTHPYAGFRNLVKMTSSRSLTRSSVPSIDTGSIMSSRISGESQRSNLFGVLRRNRQPKVRSGKPTGRITSNIVSGIKGFAHGGLEKVSSSIDKIKNILPTEGQQRERRRRRSDSDDQQSNRLVNHDSDENGVMWGNEAAYNVSEQHASFRKSRSKNNGNVSPTRQSSDSERSDRMGMKRRNRSPSPAKPSTIASLQPAASSPSQPPARDIRPRNNNGLSSTALISPVTLFSSLTPVPTSFKTWEGTRTPLQEDASSEYAHHDLPSSTNVSPVRSVSTEESASGDENGAQPKFADAQEELHGTASSQASAETILEEEETMEEPDNSSPSDSHEDATVATCIISWEWLSELFTQIQLIYQDLTSGPWFLGPIDTSRYSGLCLHEPVTALIRDVFREACDGIQWTRWSLVSFVRPLIRSVLSPVINRAILWRVYSIIEEESIVGYMKTFRNSFWPDGVLATEPLPRSRIEMTMTKTEIETRVRTALPPWTKTLTGHNVAEERVLLILAALQSKEINKHLLFVMLDLLLNRLFPELHQ
ncbi:hypothetical protein SeMB42_g04346 [Synchytrium endobioticum]|uniref:PXA domain-containing protein n=1 Tax=Synchytrium endobioticum TaxID=286115 RepID=A0A507CZ00_9FUNG|nr:hypothetical protein SeMB42_g04346 [Synchytrium endobioticum]TPX49184.1 hypothetical protein SeLEV6574_g01620 [Synchytrium endobioticum]